MDYYQKYQKYKFKYLNLLSLNQSGAGKTNLLNQSGGDYYKEEDFVLLDKYKYQYKYVIQQKLDTSEIRALFELINEEGFLKDKDDKNKLLEDTITTENIHITKAVLIGSNVHDANSILELIKNNKNNIVKDPFTREPLKLTELLDVINKLNEEKDKNDIIQYIILLFVSEIQIILKSLNEEQIKILFSKNKIDILETFGIDTFKNVLNNYKYLLSYSDTNSEDVILTAINENYKAFILVPENKQTHRICLEVVKINGFALELVPEYKKNYEICFNAVENDGFALQYVPKKINNFAICLEAVQTNSHALQFVLTDKMSKEEYLHICELALNKVNLTNEEIYNLSLLAVKNYGSALQYVLPTKMTTDKYLHICTIAVKNYGSALQYVDKNNMLEDKYYKICILAFENNALALQYVDINNMLEDEYYNICRFAIIENSLALKYVDKKIMSKDKYYKICKLALQYLDSDIQISPKEIYEICKLAVEYDSKLLEFVPKKKLSNLQQLLLSQISKNID
jgi:hypothetical protein